MDLGVTTTTGSMSSLIAGDHPVVTIPITVASGEGVLAAGTVLGRLTSGKYAAYDDTANDGSQTAVAVLAHPIDATSADVATAAIVHGEVNEALLTGLDDAGTLDLLDAGVYVKTVSA